MHTYNGENRKKLQKMLDRLVHTKRIYAKEINAENAILVRVSIYQVILRIYNKEMQRVPISKFRNSAHS